MNSEASLSNLIQANPAIYRNLLAKFKLKFNSEYHFHEILTRNGWCGEEILDEGALQRQYPYKKYVKYDDDESLFQILVIDIIKPNGFFKAIIRYIDNKLISVDCDDAFSCAVEIEYRGNEFEAVRKLSEEFSEDDEPILFKKSLNSVKALPVLLIKNGLKHYPPYPYTRIFPTKNEKYPWGYSHEEVLSEKYDTGIPLGIVFHNQYTTGVSYNGGLHLITFGPSRSGKGTSVQTPVLFEYDASIVINDPKGELAHRTAKHRRDVLGHDVYIINPFNELDDALKNDFTYSRFNPLEIIDPSDINFLDQIKAISEALVISKNPSDVNWTDGARIIIECLIIDVCLNSDIEEKTLAEVRRNLCVSQEKLVSKFHEISSNKSKPTYLRNKVSILLDENDEGVGSYISTAINQTDFLDNDVITNTLASNDINFLDLKKKKVTVYLILPAAKSERYSKFLRLFIGIALEKLMSVPKRNVRNVLFMIDECANLGHVSYLENAVAIAAGLGIQLWPFFQDINQLIDIYKDRAHSFLANAGVQQYFAAGDVKTRQHIFEEIGSGNYIHAQDGKLLLVTEAAQLSNLHQDYQMLLFQNSQRPFLAVKNYWYLDEKYQWEITHRPSPLIFHS